MANIYHSASGEDVGGGCLLEENPALASDDCLLEANPSTFDTAVAHGGGDAPLRDLEAYASDSDDSEDEEVEVPYSDSLPEAEEIDVSLTRRGGEPMGIVLDQDNFLVAVRPGTPAESCGTLLAGDELLSINGVACSHAAPAGELIRRLPLPPRGLYRLRLRRPVVPQRSVPGGAQVAAQLEAQREAAAPATAGSSSYNPMPDMAECRQRAEAGAMDGQTERHLKRMWHNHARKPLGARLAAAEMMRAEGNDHFSSGRFQQALDEYAYVLDTFKYEMANVARDQRAAELGEAGRGLGSDDVPRIQAVRVPCLLNSAAARLRLAAQAAQAEPKAAGAPPAPAGLQPVARGAGSKALLVAALADVAEALRAAPAAAVRAKAHFRAAQAHAGLENWREAWSGLALARELQPGSAELKELQLKVQREMRLLQRTERESTRQGAFGTGANSNLLERDHRKEFRARLALAHRLLPPAAPAADAAARQRRQESEAVLEKAAASGWAQLSPAEQAACEELWAAALPRLSAVEVRAGREEGVFPPRDQERVFGANLPRALRRLPLEGLGWLSVAQLERARGLAAEIFQRGAEQLDAEQRRLAEGVGLLAPSDARNAWHARSLGAGGAVLLLRHRMRHSWPFPPPALAVLVRDELDELGAAAWRHALGEGWEWVCVLEDEAEYRGGAPLQLTALLQHVVASATDAQRDWQLLVLSDAGEPGPPIEQSTWRRVGPTARAPTAWVYRAAFLRQLVDAHERREPPLGPTHAWVWEVLARNGSLGRALALEQPLVAVRRT